MVRDILPWKHNINVFYLLLRSPAIWNAFVPHCRTQLTRTEVLGAQELPVLYLPMSPITRIVPDTKETLHKHWASRWTNLRHRSWIRKHRRKIPCEVDSQRRIQGERILLEMGLKFKLVEKRKQFHVKNGRDKKPRQGLRGTCSNVKMLFH